MVAVQQLMITIGIFVASCVNTVIFKVVRGDAQFRSALGAQCVPGVLLLILTLILPFSPRWLLNKNRGQEALKVLARLRAASMASPQVLTEFHDIQDGIAIEREIGNATWSELLKKGISNRLAIAVLLQFFQQWTGINIIM